MKLIRFGRNKRQKALRQKLMRHYLIALISLLSFKEIKAQELPFAEPIIEPFNIYQNGYGQNWDSVTLQYFFIDIDLDGLKDLFFIDFICNEYPQFQGIYYQKNKLLESGNFSELLPIPSSFQEIYFSPTSKLTDLEEDGDLDIVRTRNYNLGYTADADMFEYVPNLSNKIDSFNFGDYVSVEEVCYSNHVGDVVNSCYNRMSIGDIDDDGDVDVLFTNLRTFYNRYLGYEVDRILDFPFFERNENTTDLLFNEPLVNPYNFEAIVNSLKLDSSFILESYISDINLDGKNDISMLSVTVNSDSISGLLNYKYQIKSFYKLSNNPTTFSENGQVIWSFKDSYTFDPALYDYYSFDTIGLFDGSFLKQSNIELIDLDNDGDQDLFFREVKNYLSDDYYNCDIRYKTRIYYFENQSIVSSIEETEKRIKIEVYPNPSNESIHFKTDAIFSKNAQFELYNINGSLVFNSKFSNQNFDINKGELPSGIYYYKLYDNQILLSGSLVFQ